MSQWHRRNPHLVGSPADPWMIHDSYRRHVPMPESERELLREGRERTLEEIIPPACHWEPSYTDEELERGLNIVLPPPQDTDLNDLPEPFKPPPPEQEPVDGD